MAIRRPDYINSRQFLGREMGIYLFGKFARTVHACTNPSGLLAVTKFTCIAASSVLKLIARLWR